MTTVVSPTAGTPSSTVAPLRTSTLSAFGALLLRDLTVLRKNLKEFIPRTVLQPLLLVFVFTYVLPKIGSSVGGSGAAASAFCHALSSGDQSMPSCSRAATSCGESRPSRKSLRRLFSHALILMPRSRWPLGIRRWPCLAW